jgi:hypothetical protein
MVWQEILRRGLLGLSLLAAVQLSSPAPASSQEMTIYLEETRQLLRQGRNEEALERLLWFYDNSLALQPSIAGVRNSAALYHWVTLGSVYPPARAALVAVRDGKAAQLQENPSDTRAFNDLVALNRALEEPQRTLAVFEQITQTMPDAARAHWGRNVELRQLVIDSRRLDLIRAQGSNLLQEFERSLETTERAIAGLTEAGRADLAATMRETRNRTLVPESLALIEMALALDDIATARTIQQRALAIVNDPRLRSAVPPGE